METKKNLTVKVTEPPRIANRSDALELLNNMIERIEKSNAGVAAPFRGRENAIGSEAYYWPRLEALKDAIDREII
jgi:hypothetical protein